MWASESSRKWSFSSPFCRKQTQSEGVVVQTHTAAEGQNQGLNLHMALAQKRNSNDTATLSTSWLQLEGTASAKFLENQGKCLLEIFVS